MDIAIQRTDTEPRRRRDDELLEELHAHQIELEMQNEQLRQSQLELEKSRDRYVDFYDFAPVGYLTLSRNGVIDEINLTGAALLGVTRGKLLQRRFAPFIAPVDRNRWDRFFLSILKKDHKLSCEVMFEHGDKSCLCVQLDCRQLTRDGREVVVRVSMTDITERKQLEKARQEMLERFLNLTRRVPGIVSQFQLRPNGSTCMPYASDALHRIFRLNPEEVKKDASKLFARVHPDDLESLMASIQLSARTLTTWQHDFRLKHDDGTLCWLFGDSMPQREADGSTLWHGFLTDITERKLVEQKLIEYNNEIELRNRILKLIGQDMPLPELLDKLVREIEILHPETRCSVMLLDEPGKRLRLCAAPSLPEAYRRNLDSLAVNHGNCACCEAVRCSTRIDVENTAQHGCKFTPGMQSCCAQPILDGDGHIHGTFTLYHTQPVLPTAAEILSLEHYAKLVMLAIEREQARLVRHSEHELKAYQSAARRYASHLETMREEEKNNFAREMHDDLGSTLTALRMEAYLLTKKLSALEKTTPLVMHTELMMKLIDNTKIAMRRIIIGLRPSILDDFGLQEALEWHAEQFHQRNGIACQVNCVIDQNCENELGKTHPINLFRIFQEALTNVARHSGATLVEVEFHHNHREIKLSVSDNGCGLPKNHAINPGSFGMVGMSERAAQMGGKINFDSPADGGFCVTVILPLLAV